MKDKIFYTEIHIYQTADNFNHLQNALSKMFYLLMIKRI